MAITTLTDLQQYLTTQASQNNGTVTFDSIFLDSRVTGLIDSTLIVSTGSIQIAGVTPSSITMSGDGSTLFVSGVLPDAAEFFQLTGDPVNVAFQLSGTEFDFILAISLPEGWLFGDSLPPLTGIQASGDFVADDQTIYFSTFASSEPVPAFPQGNVPPPTNGPVALVPGLNYYANAGLEGIFQLAATILGLTSGNFGMWGPFTADPDTPSLDLQAPTGTATLSLGFIDVTAPFLGIKVIYLDDSGSTDEDFGEIEERPDFAAPGGDGGNDSEPIPFLMFYLGTTIEIQPAGGGRALSFELDVLFQTSASPSVTLSIDSSSTTPLDLDSLASLLMGSSAAAITTAAGPLSSVLGTITLEQFSATFQPSMSTPLQTLSVTIGTSPPWTLPLTISGSQPSLDLTLTWMILFGGPEPVSTVKFTADLELSSTLTFGLEIDVSSDDVIIIGREKGTVTLSELLSAVSGGAIDLPTDLVDFEFTNFTIEIDTAAQTYVIGGTASADLQLFGAQLLALQNMQINVLVNASQPTTTYTATLNGIVAIGPIEVQTSATISDVPNTDIVFTLNLVNETVDSMLDALVQLVDPTFNITFPAPWDQLLDVNLDAIQLQVNVTQGTAALDVPLSVDLEFISLTGIALTYATSTGSNSASSVTIAVSGSFLGQSFGSGSSNPPLSWDAVNDNPPSVPGGSSLFDLQYIGLGQHIALNATGLTTVQDVMSVLIQSVVPGQAGALPQFGNAPGQISFSQTSDWLIGAQFTVMDTVALSVIFNDPDLYGLLISLSGDSAGSFAGLSFEILYQKVTDTIGVYHIDLQLPDAMRNLQFGEVSLTLPIVTLDIYTNGNFRVDMGFPNGLDFSNSFSVQVFPFVGFGGFYFALLDGSTSTQVPQVTNGTFSPVVEFGIALSIGVGKTVDEGILSGGISVTVVGILQGVVAWFNPTNSAQGTTIYYWVQGTIAIVGQLYATINFAIIQASVNVTATASVTLTIEVYEPILIELSASVSVSVSVHVIFFTIHLSFSATIDASFTIGSASTPPWTLAPGGTTTDAFVRRLPGQKTIHSRLHHVRRRKTLRRERIRAQVAADGASPDLTSWPATLVFSAAQPLTLYALPSFTKADGGGGADAVLLLTVENSIDPASKTLADHRALFGENPAGAGFNLIAESMLLWAAMGVNGGGSSITADQLAAIEAVLLDPANLFDATALSAFLGANFTVTIEAAGSTETGVAVFPMLPQLTLTTTPAPGITVDFSTFNSVGAAYQENIPAYFQLLQTQFAGATGNAPAPTGSPANGDTESIASILYVQYFAMLMKSAVKAAIDFLASMPFTVGSSPQSLAQIVAAFDSEPMLVVGPNQSATNLFNAGAILPLPDAVAQVRLGESFASIAAALAANGAQDSSGNALSASDVAAANVNAMGIYNPGTQVAFNGITYTTQTGDTLNLIAARWLLRAAGSQVLGLIANLSTSVQQWSAANTSVTDPNALLTAGTALEVPGGGTYTTVPGDTLTLAAAYTAAVAQNCVDYTTFVLAIVAANGNVASTNPNTPLTAGTSLTIPALTRALQPSDSMATLAQTLITTTAVAQASLLAVPSTTNLLAPQAVLATPLQYPVAATDSFGGIAAKFGVPLAQLAADAASSAAGAIFAAGAELTIGDVASIDLGTLTQSLLEQTEWNNLSGMVSRFFLSGLRLPDPSNSQFLNTTPRQLASDPNLLSTFPTLPLFETSGQQFAVASPLPDGYTVMLSNSGNAEWIGFGGPATLDITFTQDQINLIQTMATTAVAPTVNWLAPLELFQMMPPLLALQQHIAWQAAVLPATGCVSGSTAPSIWLFPPALTTQLGATPPPLLYELVSVPQAATTTPDPLPVGCYSWGTIVDFGISIPATDGPAASVSNAYVIAGADDAGAALLQQIYGYLGSSSDTAALFLLYSPSPTSGNPSGLLSDQLDPNNTFILKTNLSTVTNSGSDFAAALLTDPTDVYDAALSDAADFIALLWEASITRSGGFYLNYVNENGGTAIPGTAFGNQTVATVSLLILLGSQMQSPATPLQPFNNCAVAGTAIDPTSVNVFLQPVTYIVNAGDSLTTVANWFNTNWSGTLQPADVATLNGAIPLLLIAGSSLAFPGGSSYTVEYGDTLASIAQSQSITIGALVAAGTNATAAILTAGAEMQFADGILQPVSNVPPGTAGFTMNTVIPDPDTDPVDTLFHLAGFAISAAGGFMASGEGLPTTPSESGETDANATPVDWNYTQTMNVAPFATALNGSVSAALPSAQWNPYNGIGAGTTVTFGLEFQDPYGNQQTVSSADSVTAPVGYYDNLVNFASWPSMSMSYLVEPAASPMVEIALAMSMQQSRYITSPSITFANAAAAIAADLATYTTIYYQLAQPDPAVSLVTSLVPNATALPLGTSPFMQFACGAYVYLSALSLLENVTAPGTTVSTLVSNYQVTAPQLFTANQGTLYNVLFGTAALTVPLMYTVVQGDTLDSIVSNPKFSQFNLTVAVLATNNAAVVINGIDLTAPSRSTTAGATDSLQTIAAAMQASVEGIATANSTATILQANVTITVGTQSYTTVANDTLQNVATKIDATIDAVAAANQNLAGIFIAGSPLTVTDVLPLPGDSLQSLATRFASSGFTVDGLATANETVANVFAPGTSLFITNNPQATPAGPGDTLASFATANGITVAQLAAVNTSAAFLSTANLIIPGLVTNSAAIQYSIYAVQPSDTLDTIAAKFSGATAATIAGFNPDLAGLIAGGRTVNDSTSGKSVTTVPGDTFGSIIARFLSQDGVTATLAQLAAAVASEQQFLVPGAIVICPPMTATNSGGTLAGLASFCNADPVALASANAALQGFVMPNVPVTIGGTAITTGTNETFNTLLTAAGAQATIAGIVSDVLTVPGLIATTGTIVPVPPNVGVSANVTPAFTESKFPITVTLTTTRNPQFVNPDFAEVTAVSQAVFNPSPRPDPPSAASMVLGLTNFATLLQSAIPGLAVAAGMAGAAAEITPPSIWAVNFASSAGPQIDVSFGAASDAQFFALPPLSTSLLAGTVEIEPYTSGSGLGTAQSQTFQAVDLDMWLNSFLEAVDLVLSPSYAVPAYALNTSAFQTIVAQKQLLAPAIASRLTYILQGASGGSLSDAQAVLQEALLNQLSTAVTVNSLVQLPATVTSPFTTSLSPLLSGKLAISGATSAINNAFSFSTSRVSLANGLSTATFLFTVKSPADQPSVTLDVAYVTNALEIPLAQSTIADYQGSYWLQFILPLSANEIGSIDIPIPLRAYPSPVTLVSQTAAQTVETPQQVSDLTMWDFDFVYQHQDALQDTPAVIATFGGTSATPALARATAAAGGVNVQAVFAALAQFVAVWPQLKADLAQLPLIAPGTTSTIATDALTAFQTIVSGVVTAWNTPVPSLDFFDADAAMTYEYAMEKTGTSDEPPNLDTLVLTAPQPNPTQLWPSVFVRWNGSETLLTPSGTPTSTQAVYDYPSGIPLDAPVPQRFAFAMNGDTGDSIRPPLPRRLTPGSAPASPLPSQTFQFTGVDIITQQTAIAGVWITRNADLVSAPTAPVFIYQTPVSNFASPAVPMIFAGAPISIGSGPVTQTAIATALSAMFQTLFGTAPSGTTINIRTGCNYSYTVAAAQASNGTSLTALVPLFLVANYAFDTDTDWEPTSATSFVSQAAAAVVAWQTTNAPATANAAYTFDLTVFASGFDNPQPIIHATTLLYSVTS